MEPSTTGSGSGRTIAAFFDVDNTIIRGGSAIHMARRLHRRGYLKTSAIIRFGWQQVKYVLFGEKATQLDDLRNEALSLIRGWNVAEMTAIGEEVWDEVTSHRIYPATKGLLDAHLARGHEVWLVSASPIEIGRTIARRLGATGALGTIPEHVNGHYTGALIGEMLHGEAKARAAIALAEERGLDLHNSFAYGDSANDVHILSTVGFPCAINPERHLRRVARKKGWPIRDFRGKRSNGRRSIAATTGAGALWAFLAVVRPLFAPIKGAFKALFSLGRRKG